MNLKKCLIILTCLISSLLATTSCSVVMAANKKGTNIETVRSSRSRSQILARAEKVISSETLPSGEIIEIYQFKKETGSAARAFMHGMLDVGTLGLWEVVGTPVEACMLDNDYYTVKIYYDCMENIIKMEL